MNQHIPLLNCTREFGEFQTHLQIKMDLSMEPIVADDGKVQLVDQIVERMQGNPLIAQTQTKGRNPKIDRLTMLKVFIFAYSEGIYSCRDIEKSCRYDMRFRYLPGEKEAPDHTTFSRYQNQIFSNAEEPLVKMVELLSHHGYLDLNTLYIDGTKIVANTNKYTFVWKKAVLKNRDKLLDKIKKHFDLAESVSPEEVLKLVSRAFKHVKHECKKNHILFVHGQGKRKTQLQRDDENYENWQRRLMDYHNHLVVLGERNSYSKTDPEATFHRQKDDHMKNGQLQPGYNVQFASTGNFITGVAISHHANDMHTLVPFLERLTSQYSAHIQRIVADAGYESIENYRWLEDHGMESYIKPSNHETRRKRKVQKDIGRKENMTYHPETDSYECHQGKHLLRKRDRTKIRKQSGYKETLHVYRCEECGGCPQAKECIKPRKNENPSQKSLTYSPEFERLRKISQENIDSTEGINERINRSIQAEGAFSKLKEGLSYKRFRHRGKQKVTADLCFAAMGINLNVLFAKILKGDHTATHYEKAC